MLASASRPVAGALATVLGIGALLFAAIGVVVQLKAAQRRLGSAGVQREWVVAFRSQLRVVVCRCPGTWFSSPGFAPCNGGFGCRRHIRLSLHARRGFCTSSAF
jgi:hypothetical protein